MKLFKTLFRAAKLAPKNVIELLTQRGLVDNVTRAASDVFRCSDRVVYVGFDPTADSLHVGNLVSIISLLHFQRNGHIPIAVVGGATGVIGDPSGRTSERSGLPTEILKNNVSGVMTTLRQVFKSANSCHPDTPSHELLILNNADWYDDLNVVKFFSSVGSCFRLSSMLAKESVQQRLSSPEGMSFQEFSYQVFQAFDFLHLHRQYNCVLQIGGGDQWGNITAGCEFVRKAEHSEVHGLTVPLITTSTGEKIGKSAGNAVWLSPEKTSCYHFYQYFFKTPDSDVERYLKIFTFLPLEVVQSTIEEHQRKPEEHLAQKRLAECVTRIVHGEPGLCQALNATSALFGSPGALQQLEKSELERLFTDAPTFQVSLSDVEEESTIIAVLFKAGVLTSKGQGKRLVQGGGLYINHQKVATPSEVFRIECHIIHDNLTVVRIGKSNYCVLRWV